MTEQLTELATEAYVVGFPLVFDLEQVARFTQEGIGDIPAAPFNMFGHARKLAGPDDRFVSVNNDTLYSIAQVDLSVGPVRLTVPEAGDRYHVLQFVDAWTNNFAYIGTRATNYIVSYGLGDWYDLGPNKPGVSQLTPIALTATAFYFQNAKIMAEAAALLGKTDDTKRYSELAKNIATAFNEKFYNPTNHFYATDSQCANAIPLVMGICEPANRAAVVDAIVQDVRSHGNALAIGRFLSPAERLDFANALKAALVSARR